MAGTGTGGAAIEFAGVSRRFGRRWVLEGASLAVPEGSVCGLLGRNGAGKTTLMRLALGLLAPHSGAVRIAGADPRRDAVALRRAVGFAGTDFAFPGHWTVAAALDFAARAYDDWDGGYAGDLRRRFGLDPRSRVRSLSTGERAKLGLLPALARRPRVLLLDEPFGGLDIVVRREVLDGVIDVIPDAGCTVLLASHLVHELERLADRIAVLRGATLVFDGTVDALLDGVRHVVVASDGARPDVARWPWVRRIEPWGSEWRLTVAAGGASDTAERELAAAGLHVRSAAPVGLEDAAHAYLAEDLA